MEKVQVMISPVMNRAHELAEHEEADAMIYALLHCCIAALLSQSTGHPGWSR